MNNEFKMNQYITIDQTKPIIVISSNEKFCKKLEDIAIKLNFRFHILDGKEIIDECKLLESLNRFFNFPDYFGWNWDALEECLRDTDIIVDPGYFIFFDNPIHIILYSQGVLETFIDIIIHVTRYLSTEGKFFYLFINLDRENHHFLKNKPFSSDIFFVE